MLTFQYYKEKKVDVAALEVGLGGLKDATNIVDPVASVIATIDFDHMGSLGPTLAEIASHKAGIIKQMRPVIVGPHCQPMDVFIKKALECQSKLVQVPATSKSDADFNEENDCIVRYGALATSHPAFGVN